MLKVRYIHLVTKFKATWYEIWIADLLDYK